MANPAPYSDDYINDVKPAKGFFDLFRVDNFPTLYGSMMTSVAADILEAGWIYAACILGFSLFLIVPGTRRWRGRLSTCVRIVVAVGFWVCIILCNFGQDWEIAHIEGVKTRYKARLPDEVAVDLGVHIGLRSVNITLLGQPRVQQFENGRMNETIDYNERFSWDNRGWTLGRAGFGPNAGQFNQEFRAAQLRGLPYPILWIASYFTFDGDGLRWGRFYLQAGYFTHIFVWSAWALWMLTVILFNLVPRYGGYFSCLTGAALLIGNIIYGTLRNATSLAIPFNFKDCANASYVGDNRGCIMRFHYAWCFWLSVAVGICCILIGIAVTLLDAMHSEKLAKFFDVDIIADTDEFVITGTDMEATTTKRRSTMRTSMLLVSQTVEAHNGVTKSPDGASTSTNRLSVHADTTNEQYCHGFRKNSTLGLARLQRTHKTTVRRSTPSVEHDERRPDTADDAIYANQAFHDDPIIEEEDVNVDVEYEAVR